ncbi:site-specific integrase, partial [Brevundimonas naejangsanensis]
PADAAPIDREAYAAAAFAALQRKRDAAFSAGDLPTFDAEARENLELYQAMLEGGDNLGLSLAQVEGMQRATKALLTGDGAAVLASAAAVSGKQKQAVAKPDTPMLPELIDKWAAEKQPKARSVDMWRRTCAMFYAVNGEKPVGAITKADVLAFKSHLIAEGKAPATVDSRLNHLRSLFRFAVENDIIATDPAASVKAPPAKRAKEARLPYDADALKAVFGSAIYTKGREAEPWGGGGGLLATSAGALHWRSAW